MPQLIWSGYYCPTCKDKCTGFGQFAGKIQCIKCDGIIKIDDSKQLAIIGESEALRATGRRCLIREDDFKSGLECKACDGTGHTNVKCQYCKGTTFFKGELDQGPCPDCETGTQGVRKSSGYEVCSVCKGRSALIVIPDDSKRRPCTGVVISVGPDVTEWEIGMRVLYTNYTGTDFDMKGGVKIRVILEQDIMAEYKQYDSSPGVYQGGAQKEATDVGVTPA